MDRVTGTLDLRNDELTANLTAFAASRPLTIRAKFQHPGPRFTGRMEASCQNFPFDENLFAALQPKPRESLRSLNPTGVFNFFLRVTRDDPNQPPSNYLVVWLNAISLCYEKFPYPIHHICGTVLMQDNHWKFLDLNGSNGQARINGAGELNPAAEGTELNLHLTAENLLLQDELRDALHPPVQRLWNQLKPQGAMNVTPDLHFLSLPGKPEIHVSAEPVGDTASIEPTLFPYRLERIHGKFFYRDGRIDLQNMRAFHLQNVDRTQFETDGFCEFDRQGNWHLKFGHRPSEQVAGKMLTVDQLKTDRGLVAALPGRLKQTAMQLNPAAAVNVAGMVEFYGASEPQQPVHAGWDLKLDVHQGALEAGVKLENIEGQINLVGEYDGQQVRARGWLGIDSARFKDFQFTKIEGPFYVDANQVIFGSHADTPQPGQAARPITAQFYGGQVRVDSTVNLNAGPTYRLWATLADCNLKTFAQETLAGKQHLDGRVYASIENLTGSGPGVHSLSSNKGEIRLTQADIYQLPFMVSLLKLLSIKSPDASAFTNGTIVYHIEGDHVYFDRIGLHGDAISLEGAGEMDFDTNIKLTFHSQLGRSDWTVPILRDVMGAASGQLMQIHVDGTLANPKMTREVLPAVTQPLQQAETEMQSRDHPAMFGEPAPAR